MTHHAQPKPRTQPLSQSLARPLSGAVSDGFAHLIAAFVEAGFSNKEARLWVGAWRHTEQPGDLARAALAFREHGVPVNQAIPWFWERIPPDVAVQYRVHRWRAAQARRLAQAIQRAHPSRTRRRALKSGLAWAASGLDPDECLARVLSGRGEPQPPRRTDPIRTTGTAHR